MENHFVNKIKPVWVIRIFKPIMSGIQMQIFYSMDRDFKDFTYLFLERGEGREKERERNSDVREKHRLVASGTHPDLTLDWELNWQPFLHFAE